MRPILIFFAAALLSACSHPPATSTDCALRVAWDPYEPYSYSDGGEVPAGYDIDVVIQVADKIGCALTFTEMAWSDILIALQSGDVDITVGTGYKPDRAAWSWYSESYREEVLGLLVRTGTSAQFPGDSLAAVFASGLVFGKTTDDTYGADTEALFDQYPAQVRARVDEADNLQRLLQQATDGFLIEVNVAAALIRNKHAEGRVEFHPLTFKAGAYRFQMSKKTVTAERTAQIDAALQALIDSGWTAQRLQSYGL